MADVYKIQYNGMTLAYPGWNGYVGYDNVPKFKTLTLYASEGGTVTASVLTGMPGDTAQITTAYDTYYRFSGYDTAGGGSLNGDVYTFGDSDADISAVYKLNYFTATGNFNFSTHTATGNFSNTYSGYLRAATGDMPASWGSVNNVFNPNNASSYLMTISSQPTFWTTSYHADFTGKSRCKTTDIKTAHLYLGTSQTGKVNLNGTTTLQGDINIYLNCTAGTKAYRKGWTAMNPNGWTATGIAP